MSKAKSVKRLHYVILAVYLLSISAYILYHKTPLYWGTPDIQYVKAKVVRVIQGDIFADPVTGIPNFHPPFYHLFLSLFVRLGVDLDYLLTMVSIANFCIILILAYLILRLWFDYHTAFYVTLITPFVVQYMGSGNIFLATAFYFSLPIYLFGLLLYSQKQISIKNAAAIGFIWGAAFLVSPVYVFLLGVTFLYEFFVRRGYRNAGVMIIAFLITIIPFFVQAFVVARAHATGAGVFALWRGLPDIGWFKDLVISVLSPGEHRLIHWAVAGNALFIVMGLVGFSRIRGGGGVPILS